MFTHRKPITRRIEKIGLVGAAVLFLIGGIASDATAKPTDIQPVAAVVTAAPMKTVKLTHTFGTVGKPQKTETRTLRYPANDSAYSAIKRFCETNGFGAPKKNTEFEKRVNAWADAEDGAAKYEVSRFMATHEFADDWKTSAKYNCTN